MNICSIVENMISYVFMNNIERALKLPEKPEQSFFLWGPRKAGKSTLLHNIYQGAKFIDLLETDVYIKYLNEPWQLRKEIEYELEKGALNKKLPIVIDEVQRVPLLLDEVHLMIEKHKLCFVLCGSSVRKVKRGRANLLGGRALRYELSGLSAIELKEDLSLEQILNRGYMPKHYLSKNYKDQIKSYVADYLKEEIAQEALVRNISSFSNFLRAVSFSDGEIINLSNIASDCGIAVNTVKAHFEILEDTLLGSFLQAFRKRPKRRIIQSPKFYFFDVGLVNNLAKRGYIQAGSELFGKAFENWVFHELKTYNSYIDTDWDITYWRLSTGVEVDFVINDMEIAIEVKAKEKITNNDLKGLRELKKEHPKIKRRLIVSLVKNNSLTEDKIEIINYSTFIKRLWSNSI